MSFTSFIQSATIAGLQEIFDREFKASDFQISETKPEFTGDYTIVLFALVKALKKSPEVLGNELGQYLVKSFPDFFSSYNLIKGFLNLELTDAALLKHLEDTGGKLEVAEKSENGQTVMVEYSSPNTNKPLHLGHLRNNFLGWSVAEILKANGNTVVKTSIVNDRGIHICKSMVSWQKFANGATPESENTKGDHLVGDYYVRFNDQYKKEIDELIKYGKTKEEAEKEAPIMKESQQMLFDWEQNEPDVRKLWRTMNDWVYAGFDETYRRIGSDFDHTFYESDTYLMGKEFVKEGLDKNILFKKDDGSVWIDLSEENLGEKLLLRGDGTSVYMTQDIGLAKQKFEDFGLDESIYVIGDEQLHHMKVLKATLKKLGMSFADHIHHLSYGMVELTTGKMKSREGTVVDADDLVSEMVSTAAKHTEELGKVQDFSTDELNELYETLGLGAMKFYLLRVDPKKRMIFNPEESIDFHGFTGPFVQYTYARIQSILRKLDSEAAAEEEENLAPPEKLFPLEKQLILLLEKYRETVAEAAEELNPSVIANYVFQLAKLYNSFYAEHSVAHAESNSKKQLRTQISIQTADTLKAGLQLLGIKVPERM